MDASIETAGHLPIGLPVFLDLNAAGPLARELSRRTDGPLELDGSDVARLGGLCLQVLLAARRDCEHQGRRFAILAPSAELSAALSLLGATILLDERATCGAAS